MQKQSMSNCLQMSFCWLNAEPASSGIWENVQLSKTSTYYKWCNLYMMYTGATKGGTGGELAPPWVPNLNAPKLYYVTTQIMYPDVMSLCKRKKLHVDQAILWHIKKMLFCRKWNWKSLKPYHVTSKIVCAEVRSIC